MYHEEKDEEMGGKKKTSKIDEEKGTSDDIEYLGYEDMNDKEEMSDDERMAGDVVNKEKDVEKMDDNKETSDEGEDDEEYWSDDEELNTQSIDYVISRFRCPYEQQIYPPHLYDPSVYQPQAVHDTRSIKTFSTLLSEMFCIQGWENIAYEYEKLGGGWYCSIFVRNQSFKSDYCERKKDAKNSVAKKAYLAFCNA